MSKTKFPFGCLPDTYPHLESNSEEEVFKNVLNWFIVYRIIMVIYYLNDNTDKTYTLWRVNGEKYNGVELITSPYIEAIKQCLFTAMIMDIDKKVISETDGDK